MLKEMKWNYMFNVKHQSKLIKGGGDGGVGHRLEHTCMRTQGIFSQDRGHCTVTEARYVTLSQRERSGGFAVRSFV